jgi:hypothetical protein
MSFEKETNVRGRVTRIMAVFHHRSLTISITSLCFSFLVSGLLPMFAYRRQQQGAEYLATAGLAVISGVAVCSFNLFILLKDNRSGYPSWRCSLATLLWAIACAPICIFLVLLVREFLRMK